MMPYMFLSPFLHKNQHETDTYIMLPGVILKVVLIFKEDVMSLKTLAEAIILQAAEDFLCESRCEEDVSFFSGEGFRLCSDMAGMNHAEKCSFLGLVSNSTPVLYSEKKMISEAGSSLRAVHI